MKYFIEYSKFPVCQQIKENWKNILYLQFLLLYALIASATVGFGFVFKQVFDITSRIDQMPYYDLLVQGLLFAPVVEELIFRVILRKGKRNFYIFSITCVVVITLTAYLHRWDSAAIILLILLVGNVLMLLQRNGVIDVYDSGLYRYLYFGSILAFGLVHIKNFIFPHPWLWIISPLMVLPQIGLGFILSFIRVKYGIKYSIVFHFIVNMPVLLSFN
ncbi:MAG: CPBP family intramembrane metalloprotease [Marinilabiliaceae bacterium]|nr:CPBP family intramembrane metalloprotease [Marinilabiliaceae bacterium]